MKYPLGIIIDQTIKMEKEEVFTVEASRLTSVPELEVRACGNFQRRGLYLDNHYDWVIVKDSEGLATLLRLKKIKEEPSNVF